MNCAAWFSRSPGRTSLAALTALGLIMSALPSSAAGINVITYHNDTLRTGWNSAETSLTSSIVGSSSFGLLQQVALDARVDAQPLVVTGLTIGGAMHDVVYVATEGNTVYAIDASSGAILQQTNLGAPTPLPTICNKKGASIGINSTPVIDLVAQALYVIAYTEADSTPTYYLHSLSLTTLADTVPPLLISASHTLSNGKTVYTFDARMDRQRSALLETGGNIYAAFAGLCGERNPTARGWLLGFSASMLAPLAKQQLTNQVLRSHSPNDFFLTSIWMSGYGPSSGSNGNIFFVTGNTDPSGTTYDNKEGINLSESVVEWSPSKGKVISFFSPTDPGADVATLDKGDLDFGSGGVMLLPTQPGSTPRLAVAAGKVGILYLMNQDDLGGKNSGNVLGEYTIGDCWCGPSYFEGADGIGRVVTSGGSSVNVWEVQSSPKTALVPDSGFTPPSISTGQDPGFFTSISSNGTTAGSAVIWAVNRPFDTTKDVTLYAFDAAVGTPLFSAVAGSWPITTNSNIVPTVANGKVYVASDKVLSIFGVASTGRPLLRNLKPNAPGRASDR